MLSQASLLLALAASGSAHMVMGFPKPFQWEDSSTQQAPLAMADYPCKQPGGTYASAGVTQWPAGTSQNINFIGSAVHGGGSCQFSITTDAKPTKQSQWKVIESIIGGCPSNNTGNFAGDPTSAYDAAVFAVNMPKDVPSGTYTFAWTWLNRIGNREFYMNCAPIQVSGGSGSKDALAALPDMWVSNLDATCATAEKQDFQYPNPGSIVVNGPNAAPDNKFSASAGCATMTKMGSGNGQLGSPSQPTGSPAQASGSLAQPTQPASNPKPSAAPSGTGKPGVFAPGASSAPAAPAPSAPAASAPAAPAASAPAAPAPAQPQASASPQSPNNTNSSGCTPCTVDGAVVCIGTKQFGLCNRGCAVAQDLATGMACSGGQIVGATKRSIHFPRAHLHRRHGSSLL